MLIASFQLSKNRTQLLKGVEGREGQVVLLVVSWKKWFGIPIERDEAV
jgi:hypothetical protein